MQRFLENYSAALSFLLLVVAALGWAVTWYMEGRATWSGGSAPDEWLQLAKAEDVFEIDGYPVNYWGDPKARYSKYATRKRRKPIGIVIHHTYVKPVKSLVAYGHVADANRGGASFGYHFYVGRNGHIVQGAPLSRRTNHIKFSTNKQRRGVAKHLWSGNTIGVSLVGGCDPLMRPDWRAWRRCTGEFITSRQLRAGLAVVRALQDKFAIKCEEVHGHGDLQFDRENFEGVRLSRLSRRVCALERAATPPVVAPEPVAVTGTARQADAIVEKPGPSGG